MSTFKKGKTLRDTRMEGLKAKFIKFITMAVLSASIAIAMIVFIAKESPLTPELSQLVVGTVMFSTILTITFLFHASTFWQKAKKLDSAR